MWAYTSVWEWKQLKEWMELDHPGKSVKISFKFLWFWWSFYDGIRYLKFLLRLAWVWMSEILYKFSMTIRDRWHIWSRSNGCIFWEYEDGRLELIVLWVPDWPSNWIAWALYVQCMYWGSFLRCATASSATSGGGWNSAIPDSGLLGLIIYID